MNVVFAGTPEFAQVALEALVAAGHAVPLVLTQPDRPSGRGMKLHPSPVKAAALAHGIEVAQPRSLRLDGKYPDDAAAARERLLAAKPDVMVVAAYGLILPQWVLDLPARGCLNIHASLLPRWRGAAPIHRAIESGDAETGITIMQMDAGLDTGDMLLEAREPIGPDDRTASLHDRLAAMGGRLIVDALARLDALTRVPQPAEGITYAHKIEKAEAEVDWTQPAAVIERRIRAFDPFPGASGKLGGDTVKLWSARVGADAGAPGTVLGTSPDGVRVACGEGSLVLTELQRPGGKRVTAAQFLQSAGDLAGQVFAPHGA
jgi:methionyl-tRNA formyltransferase